MDGTPDSRVRNSPTPGGSHTATKAPVIKDVRVLYQKGFISEAQLNAELRKSTVDADAAYKEVCALVNFIDPALVPNGKPTSAKNRNSAQAHSNTPPTASEKSKQASTAEELLINKYKSQNYCFIKSKDPKTSLISSLVKLFFGDSINDHETKITAYQKSLNEWLISQKRNGLNKGDMVESEHIHYFVETMKTDKNLVQHDFTVEIWRANDKGEPVKFGIGDGKNKVILFQGEQEFMAVVPPKRISNTNRPTVDNLMDGDSSEAINDRITNYSDSIDNDSDNV